MKRLHRKPLTRMALVKRYETLRICTAVGLGLGLCFLVIFLVSETPLRSSFYLLVGPFSSYNRTAQVLEKMQPMLLTGCSFCLMMNVNNFSLINSTCVNLAPCLICAPLILNEGLFGGIPGEIGKIVWIASCCLGSAAVGGLVSLIPPVLKRRFGCDEVITSSLLNSIFAFWIDRFVKKYLYDVSAGIMASRPYPDGVKMTLLAPGSRLTTMFIVAVVFCFLTYAFLFHTRLGYEGRISGQNPHFARAAGINSARSVLLVSAVAGAIAGIAGTLYTLSFNQRYGGFAADISDGMFCGIFAKDNPLFLPLAALGLSYLRVTTETMANNTDVPVELLSVMTSFIIMMLAADRMFADRRDAAVKRLFPVTPEEREQLS